MTKAKAEKPAIRKKLPTIVEATEAFEKWVANQVEIVENDHVLKHQHMAEAVYPFLRATYYRWTQLWPVVCPELARAPFVMVVGDLHVENFGTWRDAEGRLVWGVNDFDEAWPAAYTVDLVRLLASAYLAISDQHLTVSRREAWDAIESGYRDGIAQGGAPYVLAEKNNWLRKVALNKLRDPVIFWKKIEACREYRGKLPKPIHEMLHGSMPLKEPTLEMKSRIAGLGSLGHPRVLGLTCWHGAHIVREAKKLTRSAWIWSQGEAGREKAPLQQENIISHAVRIPDPHMHFLDGWVVRRLAPDCCHIELSALPAEHDEERLLFAMGWDTANIHLGTREKVAALKKDLAGRKGRWLHKAAKAMAGETAKDWKVWRKFWRKREQQGH
jgi:uncharacterized protein (DUF2252 family)